MASLNDLTPKEIKAITSNINEQEDDPDFTPDETNSESASDSESDSESESEGELESESESENKKMKKKKRKKTKKIQKQFYSTSKKLERMLPELEENIYTTNVFANNVLDQFRGLNNTFENTIVELHKSKQYIDKSILEMNHVLRKHTA